MVCLCSVILFMCCCAQKQGQTQVEPFSILLCSCNLWLWNSAHWLPGSHPKSLVKHLHSFWDGLPEFQDSSWQAPKSSSWKMSQGQQICPVAHWKCCKNLLSRSWWSFIWILWSFPLQWQLGRRTEVWATWGTHVQLQWTPGMPGACSWRAGEHQAAPWSWSFIKLWMQEILPSKQPGCHPWHRQSTTLGSPNDPRQSPQDVQTWGSCQLCVGRWCPGTAHLALSTPQDHRAGTEIQIPSQLHFYLKDMGKHPAQNLLSSAPLCLEAEGVFAE